MVAGGRPVEAGHVFALSAAQHEDLKGQLSITDGAIKRPANGVLWVEVVEYAYSHDQCGFTWCDRAGTFRVWVLDKALNDRDVPVGPNYPGRTAQGTVKFGSLHGKPWAHVFTEEDGELRRPSTRVLAAHALSLIHI